MRSTPDIGRCHELSARDDLDALADLYPFDARGASQTWELPGLGAALGSFATPVGAPLASHAHAATLTAIDDVIAEIYTTISAALESP